MLDELLGRAELKARIADLEAETESLRERFEAEQRRRSEAVTARQEAEREANRLADRVTELEDRVDRLQGGADDPAFRAVESLRGPRRDAVLDRLSSLRAGPEGALTAAVGEEPPEAVREAFGSRAGLLARAAPCLALTDDAGLVAVALDPPVAPEPFVAWAESFRLDRSWFRPTGRFALALVRADLFALGEYDGDERVEFRGFESDVKGDHSKGGFSQGRFERRRDEQVAAHLDRCRAAVEERAADRLFVVGEEALLPEVADDAEATAAVDATGDPEAALADAFRSFWTTRLYLL